jgi:hypothetical protein
MLKSTLDLVWIPEAEIINDIQETPTPGTDIRLAVCRKAVLAVLFNTLQVNAHGDTLNEVFTNLNTIGSYWDSLNGSQTPVSQRNTLVTGRAIVHWLPTGIAQTSACLFCELQTTVCATSPLETNALSLSPS